MSVSPSAQGGLNLIRSSGFRLYSWTSFPYRSLWISICALLKILQDRKDRRIPKRYGKDKRLMLVPFKAFLRQNRKDVDSKKGKIGKRTVGMHAGVKKALLPASNPKLLARKSLGESLIGSL